MKRYLRDRTPRFLSAAFLSCSAVWRLLLGGAAAASFLFAVFFSVALPLDAVQHWEISPALYDSEGRLFHVRLSAGSEWSLPVPLSEMGKWLPLIAVGVEDRRFYSHRGVDLLALLRALWQNAAALRTVSGASTITSQVMRLSASERPPIISISSISERSPISDISEYKPERKNKRGLAVKAKEFIQALKLERVMGKNKILEIYLNRAPFGGNIRGVEAASRIYFGKPASKLSPGEACLLIGMLKGPSLYRPDKRPEAARQRRDFIVRLLEKRGIFTRGEARLALMEDLPSRWIQPPRRAFHFAEMALKLKSTSVPSSSASLKLETTLNLEFQTKLEALLERAVASLPDAVTAAAGVMDNRTGSLTAWVGNARFGKGKRNAWVDCGLSPRSPGSALKPFTYLAAFDKGILTPGSLLADSPLAFSGRAPRNFDLTYRGAVSARVALSDSLNAPAVRVLRMAGPENVLRLMRGFGFELNNPASHYGDSLTLGGCEVTLLQMLSAYSALANGGVHHHAALLKLKEERKGEGKEEGRAKTRRASEAAAWMIADILMDKERLSAFARETGPWRAAFKTGTSYGLRDAWTAAWTPSVTVVVWVGDPGGDSWPGLVGAQVAAPIALSALRLLSPKPEWYGRPDTLVAREVCALSGRPPAAACLSTRLGWSIKGVTQEVPCNIHVMRRGKSVLSLPAELAHNPPPKRSLFGRSLRLSPTGSVMGSASLPEIQKSSGIAITSPIAGAVYYLAPLAKEQKIPLRAEGAREKVWWYLNGQYIGNSPPNEAFFYAFRDGRHRVSASDSEGRASAATITVISPRPQEEPLPLKGYD